MAKPPEPLHPVPFNPLNRENLAASVAEALLESDPKPLGDLAPFFGVGIYAIYYTGDFPAYDWISRSNRDGQWLAPIYVGKAVPKGARKGNPLRQAGANQRELSGRLKEHADSIRVATSTLRIEDFHARYLVVEDIWIPLAEALMITHFAPIWNNPVEGFGNHDPGAGRYEGLRPRWDVLHPGRPWAVKCRERSEIQSTIASEVSAILAARPEPKPLKILKGQ